uniref:ATP synthase subunit a n=1 Tax=Siphonaria pectinata TaxID=57642 RepID=B3DFE2_9GAST|nr:ATP synthase F0 subunit 6 [Siphonaria pectinata]ACE62829.1 ATP synthase F0 subunit 6 [Siphonaria pectinata]
MATDLFSALDSNQIGTFSFLVWMTPMIVAALFFNSVTWVESPNKVLSLVIYSVNSETNQKKILPLKLYIFSLMFFLVSMNLIGLAPYVYGTTSALWVASSLALVSWGMLILSGWIKFPKESAAHLAPAGAPAGLMPLLVLIETISILIRPLTLTVRLVANISAGHIVMSLIASCLVSSGFTVLVPVFFVHIGYSMFEVFVCFIQAYIFSLLIKLYAEEHP